MKIDLWLYGELSRFSGDGKEKAFAHSEVEMPDGSTIGDLLGALGMPTEKRGLTFINGAISAMPGLQPDLCHVLHNEDRVGIFPEVSMLPFHYREGAPVVQEFADAVRKMGTNGIANDFRAK